jgi:hypothetical protein
VLVLVLVLVLVPVLVLVLVLVPVPVLLPPLPVVLAVVGRWVACSRRLPRPTLISAGAAASSAPILL